MIIIDGSVGEGGGQMIRTALAMSALTGKAFRITNIRKSRPNPGLSTQHLYCVKAVQQLCTAQVEGASIGSEEVTFYPRQVKPQTISLRMETAASVTLVIQCMLPVCVIHGGKFRLKISGGTDVKWSMPIDYLTQVILPHLRPYAKFDCIIERRGYFPAGGGSIDLNVKSAMPIEDKQRLQPFNITEQGELQLIKGISHSSKHLQEQDVAERQAKAAKAFLLSLNVPVSISSEYGDADSPGSGITLWALFSSGNVKESVPIILGADAGGEKEKRAEDVGKEAAERLVKAIKSGGAVDEHLADNLIPYLAFYKGSMSVESITSHLSTNMDIVEKFMGKIFTAHGNRISAR